MFRLLLALCAGLFLTMLIAGRDQGQARMGLKGAYDIVELKPLPTSDTAAPLAVAETAPTPAPVRRVVAAPQAQPLPATPVSFSTPAETPVAGLQTGLTLALPLVSDRTDVASAEAVAPERIAYVIGSNVNVRAEPSAKATVLDRLARGEAVMVLGEGAPGWSMIRIEGDGVEGYIASRFLATRPPEASLFPAGD